MILAADDAESDSRSSPISGLFITGVIVGCLAGAPVIDRTSCHLHAGDA